MVRFADMVVLVPYEVLHHPQFEVAVLAIAVLHTT
jgi:hypothetical protein